MKAELSFSSAARHRVREQLSTLGFASLEDAIDPAVLNQLQAEALAVRAAALCADGDAEVPYRAHVTGMGPAARAFLAGASAAQLLAEVFEVPLSLSEDASCYTYYAEGDRLGLHRDRPQVCVATLIVYLAVQAAAAEEGAASGLMLRVFGQNRPLAGAAPAGVIPTRSGMLVMGWGTRVWHERPQLRPGESVTALTACYRRSEG